MTTRSVILGSSLILLATSFSCPTRYIRKFGRHGVAYSMSSSSVSEMSQMSFPLSGKTAFISGSSGGIGKAIAKTFARSGADVILHYNLRKVLLVHVRKLIMHTKMHYLVRQLKAVIEILLVNVLELYMQTSVVKRTCTKCFSQSWMKYSRTIN